MGAVRARVSEDGRLSLPADLRKAVGLESGGDVLLELAGREIHIRTLDETVARAQALTRNLLGGRPGTSVEDFLMEKHAEANRE